MMTPVIQQQATGCAIASAAAIAGIGYAEARRRANRLGIHAEDSRLWSDTDYIHRLLADLGVATGGEVVPFSGWDQLPDCALLSIKWHLYRGRPHWHWVVFVRDKAGSRVLDSNPRLKRHVRTDFGRMHPKCRMHPKWSIRVMPPPP